MKSPFFKSFHYRKSNSLYPCIIFFKALSQTHFLLPRQNASIAQCPEHSVCLSRPRGHVKLSYVNLIPKGNAVSSFPYSLVFKASSEVFVGGFSSGKRNLKNVTAFIFEVAYCQKSCTRERLSANVYKVDIEAKKIPSHEYRFKTKTILGYLLKVSPSLLTAKRFRDFENRFRDDWVERRPTTTTSRVPTAWLKNKAVTLITRIFSDWTGWYTC